MHRPFNYGPIKDGWKVTRLRSFVFRRKVTNKPSLQLLSVNLPNGVVPRFENDGRPAPSEDLSGYQHVRVGDLVMNQLGKPHCSLGVSNYEGIISPAYFVAEIDAEVAYPRFVHHLLRTRLYISEFERRGKYMPPSQFDISWEQFRSIDVVLPPVEEQKVIADFLDFELSRIDSIRMSRIRSIEHLMVFDLEWSKSLIEFFPFSQISTVLGAAGESGTSVTKNFAEDKLMAVLVSRIQDQISLLSERRIAVSIAAISGELNVEKVSK